MGRVRARRRRSAVRGDRAREDRKAVEARTARELGIAPLSPTRVTPRLSRRCARQRRTRGRAVARCANGGDSSLSTQLRSRARGGRRGRCRRAINALKADHRPELPVPAAGRYASRADPRRVHRGLESERAGPALDRLTRSAASRAASRPLCSAPRFASSHSTRPRTLIAAASSPQADKYLATARGAAARIGADEIAQTSRCSISLRPRRRRDRPARATRRRRCRRRSSTSASRTSAKAIRPKRSMRGSARRRPGVRFAPLNDGSKSKERIYGGGK